VQHLDVVQGKAARRQPDTQLVGSGCQSVVDVPMVTWSNRKFSLVDRPGMLSRAWITYRVALTSAR